MIDPGRLRLLVSCHGANVWRIGVVAKAGSVVGCEQFALRPHVSVERLVMRVESLTGRNKVTRGDPLTLQASRNSCITSWARSRSDRSGVSSSTTSTSMSLPSASFSGMRPVEGEPVQALAEGVPEPVTERFAEIRGQESRIWIGDDRAINAQPTRRGPKTMSRRRVNHCDRCCTGPARRASPWRNSYGLT